MYKIFINDSSIYLTDNLTRELLNSLVFEFDKVELKKIDKAFNFKEFIKSVEALDHPITFYLHFPEMVWLRDHFFKEYKQIKAAGGVVLNDHNEILMIFRRGKWDLPKGKLKSKEVPSMGAIRETKEETGVEHLEILDRVELMNLSQEGTYHTYTEDGKRIIKLTYWYLMKSKKLNKLRPQKEEGITKVRWVSKGEMSQHLTNSFSSIADVVASVIPKLDWL